MKVSSVSPDLWDTMVPHPFFLASRWGTNNCLLLKVNQIGSVTESIKAHLLAKKNGW